MESDVTSSMMGDMYQQLATQMKGKIYKTGYRQAKAVSKEAQGSTAMQTPIMTTNQNQYDCDRFSRATYPRYFPVENSS